MSVRNPWAQHYQSIWHERAGDRRLPNWLRVASLAYGSHRANGHAQFKRGDVGLVLSTVDRDTGVVRPLDKGSVQRAIRTAIEYGWLDESSGSRCLVVPHHAIVGGLGGRAGEECPQHKPRAKVGTQRPPRPLKVFI